MAHVLLNASQHLRRNAPFALVIAGTPGLESHVAKAKTTFWERLDEGDLRLGLLSRSEAEDALCTPFMDEAHGLPKPKASWRRRVLSIRPSCWAHCE